jgi:hypothetical protein
VKRDIDQPPGPPDSLASGGGRHGRRRWIRSVVVSVAAAAAGGVVALVRTGGYQLEPAVARRLTSLAAWEYLVVRDVARRIAASDRPDDPDVVSPDEAGVVEFIDGYLAGMTRPMRRDLTTLFRYVEHVAPLSCRFAHRFTALSPADQDRVLEAMAESRIDDLRAGFEGMKSLVMMGYYRDARTWKMLGYKGPFVDRPAPGP